jgi:hypothetical protein
MGLEGTLEADMWTGVITLQRMHRKAEKQVC